MFHPKDAFYFNLSINLTGILWPYLRSYHHRKLVTLRLVESTSNPLIKSHVYFFFVSHVLTMPIVLLSLTIIFATQCINLTNF
jgi:hypothetical protein